MTDPRWPSAAAFGALAALLVTPLCGLSFSCGCDWPWDGFYTTCNAVTKNSPLPHCPWCTHPLAAVLNIGFGVGAGSLAARKVPTAIARRGVEGLFRVTTGSIVFVAALCLAGWFTTVATGYPSFFGKSLH